MEVVSVKKTVCMIVPSENVKGGIASVVNGYRSKGINMGCELYFIESYMDGSKIKKFSKAIVSYFKFIINLMVKQPNIIHIHSSFGPSFYRKLPFIVVSRLFRKKIVNHIHGADFNVFYSDSSWAKKHLIKYAYNACDVIIALSEEWKKSFCEIVDEKKIFILENYSFLYEDNYLMRLKRDSNKKVLFLGQIGMRKGCYDIPGIISRVKKSIPDINFTIAGVGEVEELKEQMEKENVISNTDFPGWVSGELRKKLLNDSDILILPSYNEGMPMAILDAMGYGMPIISTKVGGIPKIVKNSRNGFIFEPGNIEDMGDAIVALFTDDTLMKRCISESFKIVKESYSYEVHIKKLFEIYSSIDY